MTEEKKQETKKEEVVKVKVYEIPEQVFLQCKYFIGKAHAEVAAGLYLNLLALKPKEKEIKTQNETVEKTKK